MFFSGCLPNIYFNILEYLSTLDLLSFDKSELFINTLCYTKIYNISGTALLLYWLNQDTCLNDLKKNSNRGLSNCDLVYWRIYVPLGLDELMWDPQYDSFTLIPWPFYEHKLTLTPAWINNAIYHNVLDEITDLKLQRLHHWRLGWMRDIISHLSEDVITYPCWD